VAGRAPSPLAAAATTGRGRRHRRHNGRPRTIGQLCCSIARKGVRYLRRCTTVGNDPDAKPVRGTPRAGRYAAAVVALDCYSRHVRVVARITTDANERPFALGRLGARHKRSIIRPSVGHSPPAGSPAPAGKQIKQPKHIPVVAGTSASMSRKRKLVQCVEPHRAWILRVDTVTIRVSMRITSRVSITVSIRSRVSCDEKSPWRRCR
jgi:hypothetical protein